MAIGERAFLWMPPGAVDEREDTVMGAIFFGIADAFLRKRRCWKCGKEQVVSRERKRETVSCVKCGEKIPPPKK